MIFSDFGMDTASLAGSLETKLAAVREAGFSQVMISAADVVGHPGGVAAGIAAVRASGLRVTGLEALRDFEGLGGQLHAYKVDIAKSLLDVCGELGRKSAARRSVDVVARRSGCRCHPARPAQAGAARDSARHQDRVQGHAVEPNRARLPRRG
jgi:sugar phosphate isomerase/epimerase